MGKAASTVALRYAIVHIDVANSRYGSDDSLVSSASCKILTSAETETRSVEQRESSSQQIITRACKLDRLIKVPPVQSCDRPR